MSQTTTEVASRTPILPNELARRDNDALTTSLSHLQSTDVGTRNVADVDEAALYTRKLFGCLFLGEDGVVEEEHARVECFGRGDFV